MQSNFLICFKTQDYSGASLTVADIGDLIFKIQEKVLNRFLRINTVTISWDQVGAA